MANIHTNCEGVSRRDLLKMGGKGIALGACGLTMADKLFMEQQAQALDLQAPWYDCLLYVYFRGGPSHTDTWDPKPGSINQDPEIGTIDLGVNDAYGAPMMISDIFPTIAANVMGDPLMSLGVVRSFDHGSNNHGNGQMMMGSFWQGQLLNSYPAIAPVMAYYGQTFRRPGQIDVPSVVINGNTPNGVNDLRGARIPTALQVNPNDGAGGNPVVEALARPAGVDADRYARRKNLLDQLNAQFRESNPDALGAQYQDAIEQAYGVTQAGTAAAAFDLTGKTLLPARNNDHAERFTLAQELMLAGVPYVSMGLGGNDSHGGNLNTIQGNWGQSYDQAIGQMMVNLKNAGKKALIICAGDFGRTPDGKGNGLQDGNGVRVDNGRDHWGNSFSVAMASVNQPKFKTNAIGSTGPDGLFTVNRTSRSGIANSLVDPMSPAALGWFIYSLMLGPELALGLPSGLTDLPVSLREAPPVDRVAALDPGLGVPAAKLNAAFFP